MPAGTKRINWFRLRCYGDFNSSRELAQIVANDKHRVMTPGVTAVLQRNCTSIENMTGGGRFSTKTAGWINVGDAPTLKVRGRWCGVSGFTTAKWSSASLQLCISC